MARYGIEDRHPDSGGEATGREYRDPDAAVAACALSRDAICWGMTHVVNRETGRVLVTFPAGGPLPPLADEGRPVVTRYGPSSDYAPWPAPCPEGREEKGGQDPPNTGTRRPPSGGGRPAAREPAGAADEAGSPKYPPGLKGLLLRLADLH